ncbi:AgmX/PglI C-terminal domain-containing protein [Paraglaciecola sp. L3A3]|uniref:AgmX/PglI C-terminal domain-containing protein n=1 Tax=Paraglaciecola sp. L3A3 TaxID=2686358 RepID=UPI00131BB514|nr:AgmX/PglI C-terminal domain-containing protein [Paraglaciecola sp. L3A3]
MSSALVSQSVLPWSSSAKENTLFSRITLAVLAITLLAALWVKIVELPEAPRIEIEKLPPQLARLIKAKPLEVKKIEPPKPEPAIEPKSEPKPEPKIEKKPEPKPKPVVQKPKKQATPKPKPKAPPKPDPKAEIAKAKAKAQSSGLLAFQDDLASMRKDLQLNNLAKTETIKGGGEQAKTERKSVGELVNSTSGGVNSANLSTNVGAKGELTGRRSTEFVAPSEGVASLAAKQIEREDEIIGDRNLENIRKTIDEHKGAIYSLYRKALRKNPELEGKITVKLVIEPDGNISTANIVSSELGDEALEKRLLARIKMIQFGSLNVTQTQLEYSFNFLPF